mgnify:CR=1 FL=1
MMRVQHLKSLFLVLSLVFAGQAMAVKPNEEEPKECKKPKFRDFEPAHKAEVAPESEISFHISKGAALTSVTAEARGEPIELEVTNRKTYITAKSKLPASLRDGFVRIHVTAKAEEGDCLGQDGWLVKIVDPNTLNSSVQAPVELSEKSADSPK